MQLFSLAWPKNHIKVQTNLLYCGDHNREREWEKQKKISGLQWLNDRADSDKASAEWDTVLGVANWGTCNMTQMNKKYLANDLLFKKAP